MTIPLRVEIISPETTLFDANCLMAVVPSVNGEIGFMSNHEIVMAMLCEGKIDLYDLDQKIVKSFSISGGYAKMQNDGRLSILIEHSSKN